MLQDTVTDHVRAEADPPSCREPPGVLGLDHRWLTWPVPQMTVQLGCLPSPCLRFRFWLSCLVTSKLGLLVCLGEPVTLADAHCREITVSEPWKWLFPDSERAFLPPPCAVRGLGLRLLHPAILGLLFQLDGPVTTPLLTAPVRLLAS